MKVVNGKSVDRKIDLSQRGSGLLLHVTSLPGEYGIGDLGPTAYRWVDMLARAKQRWWQLLPLGPCSEGNSPYRCYSAFAGNPLLISPELLHDDGLLSNAELRSIRVPSGDVDYELVGRHKLELLRVAHRRLLTITPRRRGARAAKSREDFNREYEAFAIAEKSWLDDFSLFMALREDMPGSWTDWPAPLRRRQPAALKEARTRLADSISFHKFVQFIFARQLQALRLHARQAGVSLIGDLPIFLSPESAEVWTYPGLFQLDKNLRPTAVAGVPPDLFSATGQCWGNPLYNWREMAKDKFAFWKKRLAAALQQADLVRIDHFRGFEAYWKIPAGSENAINGRWVKAPGSELFNALLAEHPQLPLVAEDLGIITPEVEALRDEFKLPGMRVLQFGFTGERGDLHTPHNFIHHCFVYTGTHDNETSSQWYASLPHRMKARLANYAPEADWHGDPAGSLIRLLTASAAGQVIIPVQDLLGLGAPARMNTPGEGKGNWAWRLRSLTECAKPLQRLAELTETYERSMVPNANA